MSNTYLIYHIYAISFLIIFFLIFFKKSNEFFSEYNHSLFYILLKKKKYFIFYSFFMILIPFIMLNSNYIYSMVIPITLLIFFDLILLAYILPWLKILIFKVKFYREEVSRESLFGDKRNFKSLDGIYLSNTSEENYIISLPSTLHSIDFGLKSLVNYMWILRLYQQPRMKYFSYILALSIFILMFYLFSYEFYYKLCLKSEIKSDIYFIIFTVIWLVYAVVRLKTLVGLDFFEKTFLKLKDNAVLEPAFRYLAIYSFSQEDNIIGQRIHFSIEMLYKDRIKFSTNIEKTVDYFIAFITTVLIMVIVGLF